MKTNHRESGTHNSGAKRLVLPVVCLIAFVSSQAQVFGLSEKDLIPGATGRYRQRIAVCVGINRYESHPKLSCAENDAAEMARAFRDFGFDEVVLLTGEEANKEAILNTLDGFKNKVCKDDLFVFYFAGHGMTVRQDGSLMGYLLPVNCRAKQEAVDGISMGILRELAKDLSGSHSLFLVDACYSGYGLSKGVDDVTATTDSSCMQVLTAGGEYDSAFETDGHGLFTACVLDSMNKVIRKGEGYVSGSKLANVVRKKVSDQTGGWQKPQFGMAGDGDVVLVKRQPKLDRALAMAE